jgi:hypothetical protein
VNKAFFKYIHFNSAKFVVVLFITAINLCCTFVSGQIVSDSIGLIDEKTIITVPVVEHSAQKATLYSAILPGLGQIYNKQAWKAVIVFAALGVSGYCVYHYNDLYNDYRTEYFRMVQYKESNNNSLEGFQFQTENGKIAFEVHHNESDGEYVVTNSMNGYHRYRDLSIIITAALYGLNIIEANVSANFFSYDISEDLSMNIEPVLMNTAFTKNTPGLKISFSF